MLKRIKEICLALSLFSLVAVPALVPATAFAANDKTIINNLCNGSNLETTGGGGIDECSDSADGSGLDGILKRVIQIFSIIVGFVAVVMIIVGGIKYITSGGDSGNISGAKNTIVYAIIGLIIVALAQVLVHFVLKNVGNAAS